jgi:hypothetical protein
VSEFAEFWELCPRKVGKLAAEKAYRKARRTETAERLLDGIRQHASAVAGKEPEYIPHPSTWLNEGRWMDEPSKAAGGGSTLVPSAHTETMWRKRLADFRKDGFWSGSAGPDPTSERCYAPSALLIEYGFREPVDAAS